MIGYPTIKSVKVSGSEFSIEKNALQNVNSLKKNPNNTEAKEKLENDLKKINASDVKSDTALYQLTEGAIIINDIKKTEEFVKEFEKRNPNDPNTIKFNKDLNKLKGKDGSK